MGLISVSIDVGNSTETKQRIKRLFSPYPDVVTTLYVDFYKQLCHAESVFYQQIAKSDANIFDLFQIKSIGDEIWCVYDLKDVKPNTPAFNTVAHAIIEALIETCFKSYHVDLLYRMPETENMDVFFRNAPVVLPLPIKAFADYIDIPNIIETNNIRMNIYEQRLREIFYPDPTPENINELYERLNIWTEKNRLPDGRLEAGWRTDYIGSDIDLFFRATKGSLPGIVTIGENMLGSFFHDRVTNRFIDQNRNNWGIIHQTSYSYYKIFEKTLIKGKDLKGVNHDYHVYRVVPSEHRHYCSAITNLGEDPLRYFGDTREFLSKNNLLIMPQEKPGYKFNPIIAGVVVSGIGLLLFNAAVKCLRKRECI